MVKDDKLKLTDNESAAGEDAKNKKKRVRYIVIGTAVVVLVGAIAGVAVGASMAMGGDSSANPASGQAGGDNDGAATQSPGGGQGGATGGGGGGGQGQPGGTFERKESWAEGACVAASAVTEEDKQIALDEHNKYRREAGNGDAANMLKLTWSDELAARAQDWASQCVMKHRLMTACDGKAPVGQNLYMTEGEFVGVDVKYVVKKWLEEKQYYDYESSKCETGRMCGHYTQGAWAKSRKMGCGFAKCDEFEREGGQKGTHGHLFGCDYSPAGNVVGQKPYEQGEPCSACTTVLSNTGWMCEDRLCIPCLPDEQGALCACEPKTCMFGGVFNKGQCRCDCTGSFYGEKCENPCRCQDADFCEADAEHCVTRYSFMSDVCPITCGTCNLPDTCTTIIKR